MTIYKFINKLNKSNLKSPTLMLFEKHTVELEIWKNKFF